MNKREDEEERLMNHSTDKKFQIHCFHKHKKPQPSSSENQIFCLFSSVRIYN